MDVDGISLNTTPAPKEAVSIGLLGMDRDEVGNQYCCSFPFEKAVDPFGDVILAYEMNGVDIPRQHGYPVRAIVPGTGETVSYVVTIIHQTININRRAYNVSIIPLCRHWKVLYEL